MSGLKIGLETLLCFNFAELLSLIPIHMYKMVMAIIGIMKKNRVENSNEYGTMVLFSVHLKVSGPLDCTNPNCKD